MVVTCVNIGVCALYQGCMDAACIHVRVGFGMSVVGAGVGAIVQCMMMIPMVAHCHRNRCPPGHIRICGVRWDALDIFIFIFIHL